VKSGEGSKGKERNGMEGDDKGGGVEFNHLSSSFFNAA